MSVYSSTDVYPAEYDIDDTACTSCNFDCDIHGYCKTDVHGDSEKEETYLCTVLKEKGYGGCTLKAEKIRGKYFLIVYPFKGAYLLAEKMNAELGVPVVPVKTGYTMGAPGLNVSNCYTKFLELVDQVTCIDEPVDYGHIISVEEMFKYCKEHYPSTVENCYDINITDEAGIVNVCDAFHHLHLNIISDENGVMGYIPPKELVL